MWLRPFKQIPKDLPKVGNMVELICTQTPREREKKRLWRGRFSEKGGISPWHDRSKQQAAGERRPNRPNSGALVSENSKKQPKETPCTLGGKGKVGGSNQGIMPPNRTKGLYINERIRRLSPRRSREKMRSEFSWVGRLDPLSSLFLLYRVTPRP